MVIIVTGKINSGKTTKLLDLFKDDLSIDDGFVSIKKFNKSHEVEGYALQRLMTMDEYPWLSKSTPSNEKIGDYYINQKTLEIVEKIISDLLTSRVQNIYLDEVGRLELEGRGFDKIIKEILKHDVNLTIAVRDKFVDEVVERYHIKDYKIIQAGKINV